MPALQIFDVDNNLVYLGFFIEVFSENLLKDILAQIHCFSKYFAYTNVFLCDILHQQDDLALKYSSASAYPSKPLPAITFSAYKLIKL